MNGPTFDNDIFISYAHIDNESLTKKQEGWIDQFHYALERRVNQVLGEQSRFWRDPKLRGNDIFGDEIVGKFTAAAILVSVISPRYVKSEWCLKELIGFINVSERNRGMTIENKSRVLKVIKTPVPQTDLPPEIQNSLGYKFFEFDSKTGRPREYVIDPNDESYRNFRLRLDDLAYDILEVLQSLRPTVVESSIDKKSHNGSTIYLAETTFDLQQERDEIKRELKPHGNAILPDRPLPSQADAFKSFVRDEIQRSNISVHLIGTNYGDAPVGEERSIVCLQNEIATQVAQARPFSRIIWLPPGVKPKDDRQGKFIDELQNQVANQAGVDLLQTNLQELKSFVQDKLFQNGGKADPRPEQGIVLIYVMCDPRDREVVRPLEDYLFEKGYEVLLPLFEGDESQALEDYKQHLVRAEGAIIYYGNGNEFWLRSKLGDLEKSYGYGRTKKWLAKGIYIGSPMSSEKERYRTHEAIVMRQPDNFNASVLTPFLAQLKKLT